MRTGRQILKRGFTLVETVVTVGIIGALAAVVYPQVVRQFDTADPARLQNDMKNLQTAIETYHTNVRGTYPGDLEDLANQITIADSSLGTATTLSVFNGTSQTPLWTGPYVDFALVEDGLDATRPTGFGAKIQDTFVCYNSLDNTRGVSAGTSATTTVNNNACPAGAGQRFLAIQLTGLASLVTDANFVALNDRFDGVGEVSPGVNGRVRFGGSTTGSPALTTNVVYFLTIPLN